MRGPIFKQALARFVIIFALISVLCVLADLCVFARNLTSSFERLQGEVSGKDASKNRQDANQRSPDGTTFVRLFKLEGTFGEEVPVKIDSDRKSTSPGFVLAHARLEADNLGFFTRLRSLVTLANGATNQRIIEVEWRIDVYDASNGAVGARVIQSEKINIYTGETGTVSQKFGAVLPDRMVVLFQLLRVSYDGGTAWSAEKECTLGEDLRTVFCK